MSAIESNESRAKQTIDIRSEVKCCPTCEQRFSRDAAFCPFDGARLEAKAVDPMSDPLLRARIDSRYDIVGVLGEGGMGRVYEVCHVSLARSFAMKVLRPELARDEDLAERFIREATATASVKHPNVVQITDFGRFPDGTPYFVMDLLVGHTLGEVIKAGGPIPAERAVRIVRKIAGALGAAHAAGVVHRDLKPDNVFLVGGSRDVAALGDSDPTRALALLSDGADVRVVDFGAAKIVGSSRVTRAGIVFGTPHYMSPEQASGQPVDHRADIYALGVIMYEMFAGRVPFEADTYTGVLTQHMFVQPVPPSQVPEAAKELGALEAITLRCLAKRPEERFASMDDLIRAIDDAVRPRGADDTANHPPEEMADGFEIHRRGRRKAARAALALVVAASLVTLFIAICLRPREAATSTAVDDSVKRTPAAKASSAAQSNDFVTKPTATLAPPPTAVDVASSAPSVGEAAAASAPRVPQPKKRRRAPATGAPGPLDDVGDPFAGKQ
jgi:serine/threonine protein kinase